MNATQTRPGRWVTLSGSRVLAFGDETERDAALRYRRNWIRQNCMDNCDWDAETFATCAGAPYAEYVTETEEEIMGEDDSETVWVPVGKRDEIELTWKAVWEIHRAFTKYRDLKRGGEQYAAMRVLGELKDKGYGLAHHEYRDVAYWMDNEIYVKRTFVKRGEAFMRAQGM